MPVAEVQSALIRIFEKWGKPRGVKVDNCLPFVTPARDVPTPLLMWLIGMGIKVERIRPYQPTDNAKVERMQDVTFRWAEPFRCNSIAQLNQALEEVCLINREQYPCDQLKGKTRAEVFPQLLKGGVPYDPSDFDLNRVLAFLAKGLWVRRTSPKGVVSFFSQYWNLTTKYKRLQVYVHLDLDANEWVVSLDHAMEIRRFKNDFITKDKFINLGVS